MEGPVKSLLEAVDSDFKSQSQGRMLNEIFGYPHLGDFVKITGHDVCKLPAILSSIQIKLWLFYHLTFPTFSLPYEFKV